MTSPTKGRTDSLLGLSMNDARILLLGILTTNKDNKVDYEKLAQKGGWKNGASAGVMYRGAYRKLTQLNAGDGNEPSADPAADVFTDAPAATPKKATGKRKKAAATSMGGETPDAKVDDSSDIDTPTKPKRHRKAPAKKEETGNYNKMVDEEPSKVTVKTEVDPENETDVKDEEDELSASSILVPLSP